MSRAEFAAQSVPQGESKGGLVDVERDVGFDESDRSRFGVDAAAAATVHSYRMAQLSHQEKRLHHTVVHVRKRPGPSAVGHRRLLATEIRVADGPERRRLWRSAGS